MPVVVASWNIILSAPLRCDGAISERYTGTACNATVLIDVHINSITAVEQSRRCKPQDRKGTTQLHHLRRAFSIKVHCHVMQGCSQASHSLNSGPQTKTRSPSSLCGRHLVRKADPQAQQDAPHDQHAQRRCSRAQHNARREARARQQHRIAPAPVPAGTACNKLMAATSNAVVGSCQTCAE